MCRALPNSMPLPVTAGAAHCVWENPGESAANLRFDGTAARLVFSIGCGGNFITLSCPGVRYAGQHYFTLGEHLFLRFRALYHHCKRLHYLAHTVLYHQKDALNVSRIFSGVAGNSRTCFPSPNVLSRRIASEVYYQTTER